MDLDKLKLPNFDTEPLPGSESLLSKQHFYILELIFDQSKYFFIELRGLVSKETVVLHWWQSITGQFSIINQLDNVNWPP